MAKKCVVSNPKIRIWTEEEILTIIDTVIEQIKTDQDQFHYLYPITLLGLPQRTLSDWTHRSPAVAERYSDVQRLSEAKITSEMIKNKGKLNTIASIFLLKCKYGYIEEEKRQAREANVPKVEETINIGFDDNESKD